MYLCIWKELLVLFILNMSVLFILNMSVLIQNVQAHCYIVLIIEKLFIYTNYKFTFSKYPLIIILLPVAIQTSLNASFAWVSLKYFSAIFIPNITAR